MTHWHASRAPDAPESTAAMQCDLCKHLPYR